jgi:uncharacterized protein (TIGR00290 family)
MYDVQYLMCTLHKSTRLVNMHGLPESIIEAQAASIGLPLIKMEVNDYSNAEYEKQFAACLQPFVNLGIRHIAFGDIYLEDLKQYREQRLQLLGCVGVFPLWQLNTAHLLRAMFEVGFKSMVCCVRTDILDKQWLGRIIDENFLSALPPQTDACGENGEYHTCCFAGPIFGSPLPITAAEIISALPGDEQSMFADFAWITLAPA